MSAKQLKTNNLKYPVKLYFVKLIVTVSVFSRSPKKQHKYKLFIKTCLKRHFVKHAWATIKDNKLFMKTCLKRHFVKHK